MEKIMVLLWDLSYKAAIVISIVLLIRGIILKKFPRKYAFWLWSVVAFCLLFPIDIVSSLSLFNVVPDGEEAVQMLSVEKAKNQNIDASKQTKQEQNNGQETDLESDGKSNSVQADAAMDKERGQIENKSLKQGTTQDGQQRDAVQKDTGKEFGVQISNSLKQNETSTNNTEQKFSLYQLLFFAWITGTLVLLLWNLIGWLKIKKQVKSAVILENNVYECEGIPGPFVLGVVSPKIYIPFHIEEEVKQYILAHEQYHIKRRDHITKILAVVILALYWFHPFVWVAYILMCRDMEMSCDEYVLAGADNQVRVKYSESLLAFATNKRSLIPQRMAFDAHTTKRRIKNVLTEKKQKRYMGMIFGAIAVIVAVVLLTQGTGGDIEKSKRTAEKQEELTELTAFVELSSFAGLQEGWYGELLKQKFHVKLNIKPSRGEENEIDGCDILIFSNDFTMNYQSAKEDGKLLPLSDGEYGRTITVSDAYHDDIFYTWDLRYDLYQQCGSPQIKNLDDFRKVLKRMKNLCQGEENVYGASIWSSFDETNLFYAKMLCSGYFGFNTKDFILYDNKGNTMGILEMGKPYIQSLEFLNQLYRDGLLDSKSRTNTYEDISAKAKKGQVLWSLTNYAGSELYNTEVNLSAGTAMYPVIPTDAKIAAFQTINNKPVIAVNTDTKHADLCKKVIDYIYSPLGMMEMTYGPEGVCWYYDEEGKAHLTETGRNCYEEDGWEATIETDNKNYSAYDGMKFTDGLPRFIFTTPYMRDDINPDTGEKFEAKYWKSYTSKKDDNNPLWEAWKDENNATQIQTYIEERGEYVIYPTENMKDSKKPKSWDTVSKIIVEGSWDAVYADSEQAFRRCIANMVKKAEDAGYSKCVAYCKKQVEGQ